MNTVLLPKVLQNITIITIITYCNKRICWTAEALSPLPYSLVHACTFLPQTHELFRKLLILVPPGELFLCLSTHFKNGIKQEGGGLCASVREMPRFGDTASRCVCNAGMPDLGQTSQPGSSSCQILQGVLFSIAVAEKETDFENILLRRCGTADKTLPSRIVEQRFIISTAGLKHSQTSWYTLTALTRQNYTWDFTTCACLRLYLVFFFLTQTCSDK